MLYGVDQGVNKKGEFEFRQNEKKQGVKPSFKQNKKITQYITHLNWKHRHNYSSTDNDGPFG